VVPVKRDGNVLVPIVGEIKAEGLSLPQFFQGLQKALSAYLNNPDGTRGTFKVARFQPRTSLIAQKSQAHKNARLSSTQRRFDLKWRP
jgi:protein involved in polysaccharide export with SLBB domain